MSLRLPSAPQDAFGSLVSHTARQWRRAINRRLQPLGLTEATWLPLLHVFRSNVPMRQKDLAASLALDTSSVVRLIDELERGGLVQRREGDDRRVKVIHVTPAGQAMAQRIEAEVQAMRAATLSGISKNELRTACKVLEGVLGTLIAEADGGGAA